MPFPNVPRQVADLTIRRMGSDVYLRFTIPRANIDGRQPADIQRVDVYGLTAPRATAEEVVQYGTLIAQVPVRKPPPPPEPVEEGEPPPPVPPSGPGLDQGGVAIVIDTLTPDRFEPVVTEAEEERLEQLAKHPEPDEGPLLSPTPGQNMGRRWYVTVGINHRGRKGALSARTPVLLIDPPPRPDVPTVTYTFEAFTVTWVVPPGAREVAQDPVPGSAGATATDPNSPQRPAGEVDPKAGQSPPPNVDPAGAATPRLPPDGPPAETPVPPAGAAGEKPSEPTAAGGQSGDVSVAPAVDPGVLPARPVSMAFPASAYNVYDVSRPDAADADVEPATGDPQQESPQPITPVPLNPQPLASVTFTDRRMAFGTARCYAVRTVNIYGPARIESEASEPACVKPIDTFAPAAPRGFAAVGTEGAINLIWEANSEADLAGYVVLRGEAPGTTLKALTATPIKETTYRDTSAEPGVRYVYAVVAVDRSKPPNVSPQSNRVEEAAR